MLSIRDNNILHLFDRLDELSATRTRYSYEHRALVERQPGEHQTINDCLCINAILWRELLETHNDARKAVVLMLETVIDENETLRATVSSISKGVR